MWLPLALVLVWSANEALGAGHRVDFCSNNTIPSNTSGMQLTKEPISQEYGFEGKFKSIHCCGRGYRSIEWFKDDVAYPWSAGVSNLIQYPEAANQTLYTQRASRSDTGNYTCRISNETHSEQYTVYLEILEKPPDTPKTTYISKDQWIEVGGTLRLYCEALVGRSYLADVRSDLRWMKVWSNDTETDLLPTQTEIKTARDDIKDIIGSYLVFDRVAAADYGTYVCVVNSNEAISKKYVTLHYKNGDRWNAQREGVAAWRVAAACVACALLVAAAVLLHRPLAPRLLLAARLCHARAAAARSSRGTEREFDVVVGWCAADEALVRGALLPTLTRRYRYRVLPQPLPDCPDTWHSCLGAVVGRARGVVVVVSPATLGADRLRTALRQLKQLPTPPALVLLQDIPRVKPESKDASGESLVALLRRTRLIPWRHVQDRDFWTALRLALPLPRREAKESEKERTEDTKDSRSSSLTALV